MDIKKELRIRIHMPLELNGKLGEYIPFQGGGPELSLVPQRDVRSKTMKCPATRYLARRWGEQREKKKGSPL